MADSIEKSIFDYYSERAAAAAANSPDFNLIPLPPAVRERVRVELSDIEVLPDEFAQMTKERGVRVGEAVAMQVAPNYDGTDIEHFDVLLVLIVFRAVGRAERSARTSRRDEALALTNALGVLMIAEPALPVLATRAPRVRNSRPLRIPRGSDNTDGKSYAVANLHVAVNETGAVDLTGRR